MNTHEALAAYWTAEGCDFPTIGASESEIAVLERRYDIRLPNDFRTYLMSSCPADESTYEPSGVSWWPLSRIKNISDEYEHEVVDPVIAAEASKSLFFADYGVWASAWAICCGEGANYGRIILISDGERFAAPSFEDFVRRHVAGILEP